MSLEPGMIFNVDGVQYPLTVMEAWTLHEHVPASAEPLGGAAAVARTLIEDVIQQADELQQPNPEAPIFESEKGAIRYALDEWLRAVEIDAFPPRAMALRHALFVEDLGALAFRDVILRYEDGHEELVRDLLVTGDPFEHEGRWWKPQHWSKTHLYGDPDVLWLIARECPR